MNCLNLCKVCQDIRGVWVLSVHRRRTIQTLVCILLLLGIALGEVGSTIEHENPPDIEFPISHLPEQSAWQEVRLRVG